MSKAKQILRGSLRSPVLAKAKQGMSEADVARVIADTKALKEAQLREDSPEQLATIPRVGIDDLERKVKTYPSYKEALSGGGALLTKLRVDMLS